MTTISGFKIYRDDVEIGDVAKTVLTFKDDLSGFTGKTNAIYTVKAYDVNGNLSKTTHYSKVWFVYKKTPNMTSIEAPSGRVSAIPSHSIIQVVGPNAAFDGTKTSHIYLEIDNDGSINFDCYVDVKYEFAVSTRVTTFGFTTSPYSNIAAMLKNGLIQPLTIYGCNSLDDLNYTLIKSIDTPTDSTGLVTHYYDFDTPVSFKTYVVRFHYYPKTTYLSATLDRYMCSEILLCDCDYV